MPYIPQERRDRWQIRLPDDLPAGDLNYIITNVLIQHVEQQGTSYRVINEIIGVLECAKLEMYRRLAAPYEDSKIAENGDVY